MTNADRVALRGGYTRPRAWLKGMGESEEVNNFMGVERTLRSTLYGQTD